jgi:predicted transcriptional regulator
MPDKLTRKTINEILTRMSKIERRLEALNVGTSSDMKKALDEIGAKRKTIIASLSPAEQRFLREVDSDIKENKGRTRASYTTISRLRDRTNLDYKTVSGYANRLVRYGILAKEWDHVSKTNVYKLTRA